MSTKSPNKLKINMTSELFYHNGKFYTIEQTEYESRESYLNRIKFIFDGVDKEKNFTELKKLSVIWRNIKLYDCEYDQKIINKIKEIDENI